MLSPDQKQQLDEKLKQLLQSNTIEVKGQNLIINNQTFTIPKIDNRTLYTSTKVSR